MPTLFEIEGDFAALDELLAEAGGDVTSPEVEAYIDQLVAELEADREKKIDGYAAFITELQARAGARKAEADRLAARAKTDKAAADRLKERLLVAFQQRGWKKVETDRFTVSMNGNGGKAPVILGCDPEQLPEAYQLVRLSLFYCPAILTPEQDEVLARVFEACDDHISESKTIADEDRIRRVLEGGVNLDFARLGERGSHIRIR